jgi:hypothetical protein
MSLGGNENLRAETKSGVQILLHEEKSLEPDAEQKKTKRAHESFGENKI